MRACYSGACLAVLGLLAGCGGQGPSSPTPLNPSGNLLTTSSLVAAAVNQGAAATATTVSPDGLSRSTTIPCASGGSMSITITTPAGGVGSGTVTTSSRLEFNECRNQTVTINGDPAIMMDGTYAFTTVDGVLSTMTATTRMTGGVRYDTAGVPGRARYDCSTTMNVQFNNGAPSQPSIASTGTITWEQPLGTVTVRPCGP